MGDHASDPVIRAAHAYEELDHARLLTGAIWLRGEIPDMPRRALVRKALLWLALGGLMIAGGVVVYLLGASDDRPGSGWTAMMLFIPAALIVLISGWIVHNQTIGLRALIRRTYHELPIRGREMVYDLSGRGLAQRSPEAEFTPWDQFRRVVETPAGFLLVGATSRVDWLPRRAFVGGESDAVAAAELLRAAVPDYRVIHNDPADTEALLRPRPAAGWDTSSEATTDHHETGEPDRMGDDGVRR